jgi:hypothetical protein
MQQLPQLRVLIIAGPAASSNLLQAACIRAGSLLAAQHGAVQLSAV